MAKNQSTYTLKIQTLLSSAEQDLEVFKKDLEEVWKAGAVPKSFLKSIEGLRTHLQSLKQFSEKGVLNAGELKAAQGDYEAYQKVLRKTSIELRLLTEEQKLAMLGSEEQRNIKAREEAITSYTKALQKNTEEKKRNRSLLDSKLSTKTSKEDELKERRGEFDAIPAATKQAADRYAESLAKIAKINEEIAEQERLIDKFRKQGLSEKSTANNKLTQAIDKYSNLMLEKKGLSNLEEDSQGKAAYEQYQALLKTITQLQTEIDELDGEIVQLNSNTKKLDEEANEKFTQLKETLKSLGIEGAETATDINQLQKIIQNLKQKALDGIDKEISDVIKSLDKMGDEAKEAGKKITEGLDSLNDKEEQEASIKAFESRIKQFFGLSGAIEVFRMAARDAIATIKELDATMTEMAVVTDLSVGDYWDQLPEYTQRANELGVSINSVYESATLYYQQGLKTQEVTALSNETLKMARIANIDAAEATDKMTAALRGFNMELNEESAQRISDVYSELAAITAASTKEIANAMTKTASIASSAGMKFETTAAFLSQIIETTRESAETAGTAMKTVIARFQELKKAPGEIGEVDGEVVDANAIETALRSVGVSLRDTSGQFRELDEVFLELSSKWNSLDKNTQRYIATIAAGSRQQSRFIAMMADYERTQELVTAANNSAGASNKQFEKTLDSIKSKMEKLKNSFHEFSMGIMNSELVKAGVDILTSFLDTINKATSGLTGLGGSLTKIIGIVAILNIGKTLYSKLSKPIEAFFLTELPELARKSGLAIGQNIAEGVKAGMEGTQQNEGVSGSNQNPDAPVKIGATENFRIGQEKVQVSRLIRKSHQKINSLENQRINASVESQKEIDKLLKKEKQSLDELVTYQEKLAKDGKAAWQNFSDSINQVSQAATGAGLALSALGGVLSSMGLEEQGEYFSKLGNSITLAGVAVSSFCTILAQVPKLLELIKNNPWILIATVALSVIIGMVSYINSEMNKNSAEGKLKAAQEATERAAEAANATKESYESLKTTINGLDDKYDNIDNLTKHTLEWREAIAEVNAEVLDLVDSYPSLAKFVQNTDGVLKINWDDPEVKKIQEEIFAANTGAINVKNLNEIATNNAELATKRDVLDTARWTFDTNELTEEINKLDAEIGAAYYSIYDEHGRRLVSKEEEEEISRQTEGKIQEWQELTKMKESIESSNGLTDKQIDILAKGLAQGDVSFNREGIVQVTDELLSTLNLSEAALESLSSSIGQNEKQLLTYGMEILNTERANEVVYDSMASSIVSLVDTLGMSEERIKQMFNIADGAAYQEAYQKMENLVSGATLNQKDWGEDWHESVEKATDGMVDEDYVNKALRHAGYMDAVLNAKGQVIHNKDGQQTTTTLSDAEIKKIISTYYADVTVKQQAEYSRLYIEKMVEGLSKKTDYGGDGVEVAKVVEKALADDTGENLTKEDLNLLKLIDQEDLDEIFKDLPKTLQDAFFNTNSMWSNIEKAKTGASYVNTSEFEGVGAGAAKALDQIQAALSEVRGQHFMNDFNTLQSTIEDAADKLYVGQQFASLSSDITNREAWEAVFERLDAEGIATYEQLADNFGNYMNLIDARYSESYLASLGVAEQVISAYNQAQDDELNKFHNSFEKWQKEYKIANSKSEQANHELMTETINAIIQSKEEEIAAYEQAAEAEAEANSKLLSQISQNVSRLRELREAEEMEKAIVDNLAQQAFLGMDTSGANALELLNLQQEEKDMLQDYEDQQVDDALARLEDSNKKAEEQRASQIELMRAQLDQYSKSDQILKDAKDYIQGALDKLLSEGDITGTPLGNLLAPSRFISGWEKSTFFTDLNEKLNQLLGVSDSGASGSGNEVVTDEKMKNSALKGLDTLIDNRNATRNGVAGLRENADYQTARQQYINAHGGDVSYGANFDQIAEERISTKIKSGSIDNASVSGLNAHGWFWGDSDEVTATLNGEQYYLSVNHKDSAYKASDEIKTAIESFTGTPSNGWIAMLDELPYMYVHGDWYKINGEKDDDYTDFVGDYLKTLRGFKTGGLADFTGPAWLDGTPERPEYILNAEQTERFFSLIDVLENYKNGASNNNSSGDNYFDIAINVEKIDNDYDVEQIADKIRNMIYEDATYRNVKVINNIR